MKTLSRNIFRLSVAIVLVVLVTGSWLALLPEPAQAAVIVVTLTSDTPAAPFPGTPGELRWAINSANSTPGVPDVINFNILGPGPYRISPVAPLPVITDTVTIDGYSQPGAAPAGAGPATILIELDGSFAGAADGLKFQLPSANNVAKGLAINRFSQNGILLLGALGTTVEGNYIGTDIIGAVPLPNTWSGITLLGGANNNIIGGVLPSSRNIISGNILDGITIDNSLGNFVHGNNIGTDMIGGIPVPNGGSGVRLLNNASSNTIGGNTIAHRNVISGNTGRGVSINNSPNNTICGNLIGTNIIGAAVLPNGSDGIFCTNGANGNTIGGSASNINLIANNGGNGVKISGSLGCEISFNLIANNTRAGVVVSNNTAYRDKISRNSIYGNGALGIDLGGDGVTPNDGNSNNPARPNRGYNFPVFSTDELLIVSGDAHVSGTAPPNAAVELYNVGATPDASGHGEGLTYLTTVTADASGIFSATLTGLTDGDVLSAIAISPAGDASGAGNTSEFSQNTVAREGASTFFFAEGYTGSGFQEYLCLGNPGDTGTFATITYMFPDGSTQEQEVELAAKSRTTVNVNGIVGPDREVSAMVGCDLPFVAERPMYFDYTGSGEHWNGGHDAVGASSTSDTWYFAEGYTGPGFDEWICVLNPGNAAADLTFRFQTEEEGEKEVAGGLNVPAHSRGSFKVNDLLGGGTFSTSLKLESTQPVVAERPMYFCYTGLWNHAWTGGHCVMGAPSLADEYYFAEGYTGASFEEWLCIQNPGTAPIEVEATYMLETGDTVERKYSVPASKRHTAFVPNEVGIDQNVSIYLTCTEPFLAERPMYFNYMGTGAWGWTGGHCVIGATASAQEWFFAEGYTGDGFEQWLCIQNPGGTEAAVTVTYYPEGGSPKTTHHTVEANSRGTVPVNTDAGAGLSISTMVNSDQPIIVERPMYFSYGPGWTGGHDVVGYAP